MRLMIFAVVALCALASCSQPGHVTITNDKLVLPSNCMFVQQNRGSQYFVDTFYKFDGTYPADWPKKFKLPDECYLATMPLALSKPVNYKDVEAGTGKENWNIFCEGVCQIRPEELVNYFRDQVAQAGFKIESERKEPGPPVKDWLKWLSGKRYPNPLAWSLRSGEPGLGAWGIKTRVLYLRDMGGYTYSKSGSTS